MVTIKVISYDESNDTFKCELETVYFDEKTVAETNLSAETVAELCPQTELLEDLPFDLVGQVFELRGHERE